MQRRSRPEPSGHALRPTVPAPLCLHGGEGHKPLIMTHSSYSPPTGHEGQALWHILPSPECQVQVCIRHSGRLCPSQGRLQHSALMLVPQLSLTQLCAAHTCSLRGVTHSPGFSTADTLQSPADSLWLEERSTLLSLITWVPPGPQSFSHLDRQVDGWIDR